MSPSVILYLAVAGDCGSSGNLLSFPTWYKYLKSAEQVDYGNGVAKCTPSLGSINDVWLVIAAVIEILLRVGALLAVGFIIWGAIRYTMSQGEPDKLSQARNTIVNALVGLVIAVSATAMISFVAGRFN